MMRQHGIEVQLSTINNYRIKDSDREKVEIAIAAPGKNLGQTLGCNQCSYTCRQGGNLKKHMQLKHGIEVDPHSLSMYRLSFPGGQKDYRKDFRVQGQMVVPGQTPPTPRDETLIEKAELPPLHHFLMDTLKSETP